MSIYFGYKKCAGLICIGFDWKAVHFHFLPHYKAWYYGYKKYSFFDRFFGFGPLLLIVWDPYYSKD